MLQIHALSATSGQLFGGNFLILLGIALSACVLGIQVACIVTLIKKLSQAKREKERIDNENGRGFHSQYGFAFLGAALPFSAEGILAIAVGLNALAALVLVLTVIILRAKGYDYTSAGNSDAEEEELDVTGVDSARTEQAPTYAVKTNEETMSEIWGDNTPADEPAVAAFASESTQLTVPTAKESTVTTVVQTGNGQTPVRVVKIEKEYSETIRETVPGAPASEAANEQTAQLIAKIDRLIDKLEGSREQQSAHLANGIILAADEPVPSDEDDEDELDDETADGASADGEEDDADLEADDSELFTGNERIIGFDEDTGCYIVAHYRKSFEAKLIQSRPNIKQYYSELKNALLAYKGTKSRISWTADSFHNGRNAIAKINVKTKILELYLALDPASLDGTVYRGQDVSHLKKYADTPFRYKIRTPRKFKWAMELVQRVCEEQGLSPIDTERVDYEATYPFEDTDSLVARGLIKEYIREEKPASTFELDETHVPNVSDLDETVIPANANILWEFDNEVMAQKEYEPEPVEEEPAPEVEEPEEAPKAEEPTPAPTVIRETVRTTQVRYTEEYFGQSGEVTSYKEYFSEDGPLKAEFFESAEQTQSDPVAEEADAQESVEEVAYENAYENTDESIYNESAYETEQAETDGEVSYDEETQELSDEEVYVEAETEAEAYEEVYEESYDEAEDDGGLDWSVPAGVSEQELVEVDTYAEDIEAYDENGECTEYAEEEAEYTEEAEEVYEEEPTPAPVANVNPEIALVDVGTLEENFEDGDQIDLETLRARGLVLPAAKVLKIYKSGELTKRLNVVADHFTMDAIFAIDGAGGNIQMIKK